MAEAKTHKARIGKGLINMLMFQMYGDCKLIYREYIQNARDAINDAVKSGILEDITQGGISIYINDVGREITITDNGIGISIDKVEAVLLDIADSDKDGETSAGQFGIGRLVGGYFCKKLSFKTSFKGEPFGSEIVFDIDRIKDILADDSNKCEAAEVIDVATSKDIFEEDSDDHYFKVTMSGVDSDYPDLLDENAIIEYLQEVAPVDYSAAFYNHLIDTSIPDEYIPLQDKVGHFQISVNHKTLQKRYGLKIEGTGDRINELEYFKLSDEKHGLLAWGWYAITDFTKAIPVSDRNSRFRLRKHNIQVGDADMLTPLFPKNESRGNKYFYGEIHIENQKIKLNSARDGLAPTPQSEALKIQLRGFFDQLVKLYHLANTMKKATERVVEAIERVNSPEDVDINGAEDQLKEAKRKVEAIVGSKNAQPRAAQKVISSYKTKISEAENQTPQSPTDSVEKKAERNPDVPQAVVPTQPEVTDIYAPLADKYSKAEVVLIKKVLKVFAENCPSQYQKLVGELTRKTIKQLSK